MNQERNALLEKSFAWIRSHPDAHNLDVPDYFLQKWIYDRDDELEPSGFFLSVFAFGFFQHEAGAKSSSASAPYSVPISRVIEVFRMWQLKLGLVEIHRKTDLGLAPLPLFAFPEGEEIHFWPRAASGS